MPPEGYNGLANADERGVDAEAGKNGEDVRATHGVSVGGVRYVLQTVHGGSSRRRAEGLGIGREARSGAVLFGYRLAAETMSCMPIAWNANEAPSKGGLTWSFLWCAILGLN